MYNKSFIINQLSELSKVSKEIIELTKAYNLFLFEGEMGSGKTTLISSIASILGVQDANSPTFSIINTYLGDNMQTIYHVDCYRIENENEVENIGLLEIINDKNLCFIEWPQNIYNFLPSNCVRINITVDKGLREINIKT
ncbi:MAG: tRNA (adenosine(37)-N6)-threonylcarbamoyltransferase complex ATPase subunit type 1 TsaE [Flavobacteriales bacterium]|jgi:tRNA threonylcarbamoyladenosine biosynthesis protein TsaE|tara:strand:- start:26 stop:445 length:420 start_codon:yes stop_codon:yes gene_type:complete